MPLWPWEGVGGGSGAIWGKEGGAAFQEKRPPKFWSIRQKGAEAAEALLKEYDEESGSDSD